MPHVVHTKHAQGPLALVRSLSASQDVHGPRGLELGDALINLLSTDLCHCCRPDCEDYIVSL